MKYLTNTVIRFNLIQITGLLLFWTSSVNAVVIGGVDFPMGDISFADVVVEYNPDGGSGIPSAPNAEPSNALGAPEVVPGESPGTCVGNPLDCPYVSLGAGGFIVLQFTDNFLTGSDSIAPDLWIFEVGADVENTFVEISNDGTTWHDVGEVGGATSSIDIDAFGFTSSDIFSYVRLTDNILEGSTVGGTSTGADIDAIGAISTIAAVPVPAAIWLFASGLFGLVCASRHNRRENK